MIISDAFLTADLFTRALILFGLIGACCGALGVWITRMRMVYLAESFPHAFLPGATLATAASFPLFFGGGLSVLCSVVLVFLFTGLKRISFDTTVAVIVALTVSVGTILATLTQTSLEAILFGDPLAISDTNLRLTIILTCLILVVLVVLHRQFILIVFTEKTFSTAGGKQRAAFVAVILLLAFVVTSGAQVVGPLLIFALIVGPALAARQFAKSFTSELFFAAFFGVLSTAIGVELSAQVNIATTAAITLSCLGVILLCWVTGKVVRPRKA